MTKSTADVPAETVQSFRPGPPRQVEVAGSEGLGSKTVAVLAPSTAKATKPPKATPENSTVILSDERGVGAIA